MYRIRFRLGPRPHFGAYSDPSLVHGAYNANPDPLAVFKHFKRPSFKRRRGGRVNEGEKGVEQIFPPIFTTDRRPFEVARSLH